MYISKISLLMSKKRDKIQTRVIVYKVVSLPHLTYIRREVVLMTAYETISIFLGILTLLFAFGSLIVALLAFLDKKNKKNKRK